MNVNPVAGNSTGVSFGDIKLGIGGAERLAKTLPVTEAKKMISHNTFVESDIFISSDAVEVIPPAKNMILKISKAIANGKDFTDVEVFEHDKRYIFKVSPGIPDSELNKYGSDNAQISLAENIARIIDKNYNWMTLLRKGHKETDSAVPDSIINSAKEIELYNKTHYTF